MSNEEAQNSEPSLGRSSMLMASGTAVSRILGFVRNILLVSAIGATGLAADVFDVANKIPNTLFAILAGGVLNAVFVPQIVKAFRTKNPDAYVNKLLTFSSLVLIVITLIMTAGASILVGLISSPNWSDDQRALAVSFAFWCIPQLFFYGLYTILGQLLNARKQFGPFMWAPVLNNVVSIIGFTAFIVLFGRYVVGGAADDVSFWTGPKIVLLAGTATLGVVSQALILIVPLVRSGFRFRILLDPRGAGLRSAGLVAVWTLAAVSLEQIGVFVTTRIAASAPWDAIANAQDPSIAGNAAYSQSLMIYLLPHSLVTVSIATALFTSLSISAQAGRKDQVRKDLSRGIRTLGVFTVLATAILVVLAAPITKALIPTISATAGQAVSQVLIAMSLGLVPLGAMMLMKWVFYAFEDGKTVFMVQLPVTIVLIGGSYLAMWLLPPELWVAGIGASMSVSNVAAVLFRGRSLHRLLGGLDGARILRTYTRTFIAAVIAAAVGWGVLQLFGDLYGLSWGRSLLICIVIGPVMTGVYLALLQAMHVSEATTLMSTVTRRLRQR